jgi:hypothetical protein
LNPGIHFLLGEASAAIRWANLAAESVLSAVGDIEFGGELRRDDRR